MAAQSGGDGEDYWKCPYADCTQELPGVPRTITGAMKVCPFCQRDLRRTKLVSEPQLSDSREAAGAQEDENDASDRNKFRGATIKTGAAPQAGSTASTLETTVAPKATPATSDNGDSQPTERSDTAASDSGTERKADPQNESTTETPPTGSGESTVATSEADQQQTDPESPAGDTGETALVTPSSKKSGQTQTPAASGTSTSGSESHTTPTPASDSKEEKLQSYATPAPQTVASGSGMEKEVKQLQITAALSGSSGDGNVDQLQTAATKASASTIGRTPLSVAPPSQQASPAPTGCQDAPSVEEPTGEVNFKNLPLKSSSGTRSQTSVSEESMASAEGSSSNRQLGSAVLPLESSGKDEYKTPIQETGNGDSEKKENFFDASEGNVTIENDPAKKSKSGEVSQMVTRAQLREEERQKREEERRVELEERKEALERTEKEKRENRQKELKEREQLRQPSQQSHLKAVPPGQDPLQPQKTGTGEPSASGTGDGSGSNVAADDVSINALNAAIYTVPLRCKV